MTTDFEPNEDDFDAIYGSKYLSAGEIAVKPGGKLRAKIARIEQAEFRQDGGPAKKKFVVYFDGIDKGMVLNVTNANSLKDMLGKNPTKWIGAFVVLYVEQVSFGNKRVPGLRLKVLHRPQDPKPAVASPPLPTKPAAPAVGADFNDDPADFGSDVVVGG